jgi:thiopurine S-methyltransferase
MQLGDWDARWRDGRIGWHQSKVTGALEEYGAQVLGSDPGRVLVPLCGKTLDLVFLAENAEAVVGVEYVEQAVQEFFDEQGLSPDVDGGPPIRYSAENYLLFASDIFLIDAENTGVIDAVFDRAALVALEPDVRIEYAAHLRSILPGGARILLVTFDYDQRTMNGPPFAVSDPEVTELFGEGFEIEHLRTRDVLDDQFRKRGLATMTESTFSLTKL